MTLANQARVIGRKAGSHDRKPAKGSRYSRGGRGGDGEVVLKLDDFGSSPRVDILMGLVKQLGKNDSRRQVQVQDFAEGKNTIGKNWITISEQTSYYF